MSHPGALSSPKLKFSKHKVVTAAFGGCNECVKVSVGKAGFRHISVVDGAASCFRHEGPEVKTYPNNICVSVSCDSSDSHFPRPRLRLALTTYHEGGAAFSMTATHGITAT